MEMQVNKVAATQVGEIMTVYENVEQKRRRERIARLNATLRILLESKNLLQQMKEKALKSA